MSKRCQTVRADAPSPSPARPSIRLGLCCMNFTLRRGKPGVYCSRTVQRKHFTLEKAQALAQQNCRDLLTLLRWNEERAPNAIRVFRVSSDLFPRYTDAALPPYSLECARDALTAAGAYAAEHGHRLLMHPGQFNQIGTHRSNVFDATVADLSYQAAVLDMLGVSPDDGVLIVHGGGTYGDKVHTKRRWIAQFAKLPAVVRRRLALENDERHYSVADCLEMCSKLGIPMVYDCFHHACYTALHPNDPQPTHDQFLPRVLATWGASRRPVMHVSEQRVGHRVGAHSDFVSRVPQHVLDVPSKYGRPIDLEVEAKKKELAIARLFKTHATALL